MKKKTHPKYQQVLFVDSSTGYKFLCGTTLQPKEKEEFEGKEYPVFRVPVSSSSHPFFTGDQKFVDSEGRIDKFKKRYGKTSSRKKKTEEVQEEK
ncbi:MAG: type B 50S ribosomal protein L31 [Waddliaceae bacterium]|jgi:large subunit ribosomal protein L31|nr:type B 50S ribosomal protein L31 [Waddliaceae bacterium]MBT3579180.1 type B 50S ribosomal protein L31 [Waddliaceae bacterium]MBT4444760.1 type B 50S ribosomal protein L31 [Waddliaceae bacterium]MBT6928880.1 type B 50S ribosomal protein L31 [Waddliaceae bacterium]MBT7264128.1 type B 50S ribosomal protein L31 [Waddliaceae bacterium]